MIRLEARIGLMLLIAAASISFIFQACKSEDLEFVQPFDFVVEEFKEPEIELQLEAPKVVEPATPSVQTPKETEQQAAQITSAAKPSDLPPAVQTTLTAVATVTNSAGVPSSTVNSFDKSDFSTIKSTPVDKLDPIVLKAGEAAAKDPVLKNLFPKIVIPGSGGRIEANPVIPRFNPELNIPMQPFEEVTGPCADKVNEGYEKAVAKLNEVYDQKRSKLNRFYDSLEDLASKRLVDRKALATDSYTKNELPALDNLISNILDAVERFRLGPPLLDPIDPTLFHLRAYGLMYYTYAYFLNTQAYNLSFEIFERAYLLESNNIINARKKADEELFEDTTNLFKFYEEARQKALTDCHNQGGGN